MSLHFQKERWKSPLYAVNSFFCLLHILTSFTFSIDVAAAAGKGTLRHLAKPANKPAKPDKKPGPPGGHPNKSGHTPNNGCPKQVFPAAGSTECPNGGAFGTDTCIACCECECDGTTVEVAKPKCEFEGEEGAVTLETCDTHGLYNYTDASGDCDATCDAVCNPV